MAFSYGFYNSRNGDRKYNAEQMGAMFDGVITDGVFDSIGELFATVPGSGLQVLVKSGRAWFNNTWSYNDSALPLSLSLPDLTRTRIDAVVLEVNQTQDARKNTIKIVQGEPLTTPKRPSLTNTDLIHQYPLAYVSVRGNVTQILSSDIDIMVGQTPCPFVTSVLQSVPIDDLFSKWEGEFEAWFNNLKAQLTDNVVANLQRQIDAKVNVADKATPDEVLAGVNNTKWITPAGLPKGTMSIINPKGQPIQVDVVPKALGYDIVNFSNNDVTDAFGGNIPPALSWLSLMYHTDSDTYFMIYCRTTPYADFIRFKVDDNGNTIVNHDRVDIGSYSNTNTPPVVYKCSWPGIKLKNDIAFFGGSMPAQTTIEPSVVDFTVENFILRKLEMVSNTSIRSTFVSEHYYGFSYSQYNSSNRTYSSYLQVFKKGSSSGIYKTITIYSGSSSSFLPNIIGVYDDNVFIEKVTNRSNTSTPDYGLYRSIIKVGIDDGTSGSITEIMNLDLYQGNVGGGIHTKTLAELYLYNNSGKSYFWVGIDQELDRALVIDFVNSTTNITEIKRKSSDTLALPKYIGKINDKRYIATGTRPNTLIYFTDQNPVYLQESIGLGNFTVNNANESQMLIPIGSEYFKNFTTFMAYNENSLIDMVTKEIIYLDDFCSEFEVPAGSSDFMGRFVAPSGIYGTTTNAKHLKVLAFVNISAGSVSTSTGRVLGFKSRGTIKPWYLAIQKTSIGEFALKIK